MSVKVAQPVALPVPSPYGADGSRTHDLYERTVMRRTNTIGKGGNDPPRNLAIPPAPDNPFSAARHSQAKIRAGIN